MILPRNGGSYLQSGSHLSHSPTYWKLCAHWNAIFWKVFFAKARLILQKWNEALIDVYKSLWSHSWKSHYRDCYYGILVCSSTLNFVVLVVKMRHSSPNRGVFHLSLYHSALWIRKHLLYVGKYSFLAKLVRGQAPSRTLSLVYRAFRTHPSSWNHVIRLISFSIALIHVQSLFTPLKLEWKLPLPRRRVLVWAISDSRWFLPSFSGALRSTHFGTCVKRSLQAFMSRVVWCSVSYVEKSLWFHAFAMVKSFGEKLFLWIRQVEPPTYATFYDGTHDSIENLLICE